MTILQGFLASICEAFNLIKKKYLEKDVNSVHPMVTIVAHLVKPTSPSSLILGRSFGIVERFL